MVYVRDESKKPEAGTGLLVAGWVMAGTSFIIPLLALGSIIIGIVAITRDRVGHGVGMLVTGLLVGMSSWLFWIALMAALATEPSY